MFTPIIPTNHERLQTISKLVRAELKRHEKRGGYYYDETAEAIAARAIETCMPSLVHLQQERVVVESGSGIAFKDKLPTPLNGLRVEAQFVRVGLQSLLLTLDESDPGFPIVSANPDLFALLRPVYFEPDPEVIELSDALIVPFEEIQLFEPVEM